MAPRWLCWAPSLGPVVRGHAWLGGWNEKYDRGASLAYSQDGSGKDPERNCSRSRATSGVGTTTLHAPQTARWSAPRLRARRPSSQRGAPSLFPCRSIRALGWGSAHPVRYLAKRFPHEAPAAGSDAQSMSTNPAAPAWVPMTCTCFSSPTALQTVCVSGSFQAAGAPSPAAVPMWAAEDSRAVFKVRGGHIRRWENSCRCPDVPIVRTPVP